MQLEAGRNYIGVIFLGSEGYLTVDSNGYQVFLGDKRELTQHMEFTESEPWATAPHVANFLKAVRSRKRADLNCDILEGHIAAAMCHMANISYRTGRNLTFHPDQETFGADAEANRHLSREHRAPFTVKV